MGRYAVALILCFFSLWRSVPVRAQNVLAELEGVDVRVRIEGASQGFPLGAGDLDRIVRDRLAAGGLNVTDVIGGAEGSQAPILEILLVLYADTARVRRYAFSLTGTLLEGVTLRRGGSSRVWAQTWNGGATVGIIGADSAGVEFLRSDVRDLVERFLRERAAAERGMKGKGRAA